VMYLISQQNSPCVMIGVVVRSVPSCGCCVDWLKLGPNVFVANSAYFLLGFEVPYCLAA
jgi:hypothetical protein